MFYTLASQAVRSLTSNRGTFAAAVATGAVVIALTASVLRLPWTLLLKPLPYERPARLVMLWQQPRQTPDPLRGLVTPGVLLDWIARQQVFSEVAAAELWDGNPTAWVDLVSGPPERLRGALVTPNFFRVLGVSPLRGHWPETGAEASVLLGYDLWQRRFGGDPNIVGQPLTLILGRGARRTPRQFTIAGVLPKGIQFTYPRATEIWLPLPWQDVRSATPQEVKYEVVGRLRSGVSRDDAARHMRTIVESSSPDLSWFTESETVRIESMVEYVVGSARRPLALLSGLAIALLAVGAVNMTTLVLLLAERRRRETAMHVVLGATTRALLAGAGVQIATIVLAAATAGAVLSVPVLALVDAFLARSLPRTAELRAIDMALPALLALSLVSAIVIGFSPALIVRSRDVRAESTASATSTPSARTYRWRRLLLALHVSLLFGLSLAATFAITSLWRAQNADMGFDGAGIHVAETRLIGQRYPPKDKDARRRVRQGLVDRVRAEPGVIAAATSSALPLRGTDWLWIIRIPDSAASFSANGRQVDPAFFDVLQVRLVAGRFFDKHDDAANEQVAIVSTALASRLFGSAAAVGREVVVFGVDPGGSLAWWRI